jgi:hypothetical protein
MTEAAFVVPIVVGTPRNRAGQPGRVSTGKEAAKMSGLA